MDHHEHVEHAKCRRDGHEEVTTDKSLGVVSKTRRPALIARWATCWPRKGYLIEEQGVRYLAQAESDRALTPLQAAACTYRIALGPYAGQKVLSLQTVPSRAADSQQPGGRLPAAGLRQRARLQPACGRALWRR